MNSILDYQRLVYSIIRKYSYNENDFEDLYQEGMKALQKASENYNPNIGSDFSTYAYLYIKGEVLKYIRENKTIKVSKDYINLNKLINKTKEYLQQKYMREVTIQELSQFLEIPIEKINNIIISCENVKSMDYEYADDGKELNMYDSVGYIEKNYSEDILDLKDEINNLEENDRRLINLRYFEEMTQQETAKILGMSQVQVSRKETKILQRIKTKLVA